MAIGMHVPTFNNGTRRKSRRELGVDTSWIVFFSFA